MYQIPNPVFEPDKRITALALATAAGLTALYLSLAGPDLGELGGDTATYVLLAEALAQGHGYRDIFLPGFPPHLLWPPLFPLMLAPILHVAGRNFFVLHCLVQLCAGAALILGYFYFRPRHGPVPSFLLMLFTGTQPFWVGYQVRIAPEMPFVCFVFCSLFALRRYRGADSVWSFSLLWVWLTAAAAFLTRTMGVVLLPAVAFSLLRDPSREVRRQRRLKTVVCVAGLMLPVLLWEGRIWTGQGQGQRSYFDSVLRTDYQNPTSERADLREYAGRIVSNWDYYSTRLGQVIFALSGHPAESSSWRLVLKWLGVPFALFILLGLYLGLRTGAERAAEVVVLGTLILLLAWTTHSTRHLLPLFPFLFHSFLLGLQAACQRRSPGGRAANSKVVTALLVAILAGNLGFTGRIVKILHTPRIHEFTEPVPFRIDWSHFAEALPFRTEEPPLEELERFLLLNASLAQTASPAEVILSRKPALTYLFTQRRAVFLLHQADDRRQFEYLKQNQVRWIIADPRFASRLQRYLFPALLRYPETFQVVYRFPDGKGAVLELRPEHFPSGSSSD